VGAAAALQAPGPPVFSNGILLARIVSRCPFGVGGLRSSGKAAARAKERQSPGSGDNRSRPVSENIYTRDAQRAFEFSKN